MGMSREIARVAREISSEATAEDVAAAQEFLAAEQVSGYIAALQTRAAAHLTRKFSIRRCLQPIARQIVTDHPDMAA